MAILGADSRQNLTIKLAKGTIQKVKVLAARRSTSISKLVAEQIESLVGEDDAYEQATREALASMKKGFHLGGKHKMNRNSLHER
ncbi:hypothetical protein ACPOL_3679 [Acidisarcina polymorpha]|uniref:CopG family transcriptional regulator n=1 Tax=Acidisarcina polymorpha TaxID=2211140 RepID=A0A2Z5G1Q4_9BACT|nr:DUF6364 family protein [Acidisarcina polymorpha]AXC12960.1 hypothetical protein ACPOL_3679 [Acidisarcina polymorpha]